MLLSDIDLFGRGTFHPSELDRCVSCSKTMVLIGLPDAAGHYATLAYRAARLQGLL